MTDRQIFAYVRTWGATLGRHLGALALVIMAFVLGLCLASGSDGHDSATPSGDAAEASPPAQWTCPMHPQIRKSEPGDCPLCGMDLTRVEAATGDSDDSDDTQRARITLSPRAKILASIRTAEVKPVAGVARELRLLGRIAYDETRIKSVTAWTKGRIDRLRVAATGRTIAAKEPIAKLYSPEIYAAQSDLIQAHRQVERLRTGSEPARQAAEAALGAAEQRLRLLGLPSAEIKAMRTAESPQRHIWIRSPFAGTVIERLVDEGNYIAAGAPLYRIADLSRVWVQLDAYETDLSLLRVGNRVSLSVVGLPERVFAGEVSFIDPVVDMGTRIVKLRVEVANPDGHLRPGMFAEAVLSSESEQSERLMIPDTAPLFTGVRSLVYVEIPDSERPTYEAREVTLGARAGSYYPVLHGLRAGEKVVVRGAFVIDADLQIRGGASMMTRDDDVTRAPSDHATPDGGPR